MALRKLWRRIKHAECRPTLSMLDPSPQFAQRHIGPDSVEVEAMLEILGLESLESLMEEALPATIRTETSLSIGEPRSEHELLETLRQMAERNQVKRSCIGMGYYDTVVPGVIQRNVLENPAWYTQYTPYQSEISQGPGRSRTGTGCTGYTTRGSPERSAESHRGPPCRSNPCRCMIA